MKRSSSTVEQIKTKGLQAGRLCMKMCAVFLISSVVSLMYIHHSATNALGGQQEDLVKKMEALQQKMDACGSDLSCVQQVTQEMAALAQQMSQAVPATMEALQQKMDACGSDLSCVQQVAQAMEALAGQMSPVGREPCEFFRRPGAELLGVSCLPVIVKVSDFVKDEGYDFIYSGIWPDPGKKYTTHLTVFSYEAEAQGELVHNDDFSEFYLMTIDTSAKAEIHNLYGYIQTTDLYNNIKRRDYHPGKVTVRRPFQFSIWFPVEEAKLTNSLFNPVGVETEDDWISTTSGSQISDYSINYGLKKQFMVTPDKMKQFVDDGGFQETFQWKDPQPSQEVGTSLQETPGSQDTQPGAKRWTDHKVTVAAEIIKLTIVKPTKNKNRFCYSNVNPGILKLNLEAKVTPAKYKKDIKWTVPQIAGSTRTDSPNPLVGPKVKVTYSGLPRQNSEFGKKTIVAEVDVSGSKARAKVEIEVFFPRDATNGDPNGREPNWFYYWRQTSAATLRDRARYDGFKCRQEGGTGVETLGYYDSEGLPDYYYVCDLVQARGKKMAYRASVWEFKAGPSAGTIAVQNKPLDTEGIDTFALTTLHEAEHYTHLRKWWIDANGKPIAKRNRVMGGGSQKKPYGDDSDRDDIPDQVEDGLKENGIPVFVSTKLKTYPTIQTKKDDDDEELYTQWVSHGKFKPVDKEVDWAKPGKQWK